MSSNTSLVDDLTRALGKLKHIATGVYAIAKNSHMPLRRQHNVCSLSYNNTIIFLTISIFVILMFLGRFILSSLMK